MKNKIIGNTKGKKKIVNNTVLQNILGARGKVKEFTDRVFELINDSGHRKSFGKSVERLWLDYNKCKSHLEQIWKGNNLSGVDLEYIVKELWTLYNYIDELAKGQRPNSLIATSEDGHRKYIYIHATEIMMSIDDLFTRLRLNAEKSSVGASNQQSDNEIEKIIWSRSPSDLAEIIFRLWENGLICPQESSINGMFKLVEKHFVTKDHKPIGNLRQLIKQRLGSPVWTLTNTKSKEA